MIGPTVGGVVSGRGVGIEGAFLLRRPLPRRRGVAGARRARPPLPPRRRTRSAVLARPPRRHRHRAGQPPARRHPDRRPSFNIFGWPFTSMIPGDRPATSWPLGPEGVGLLTSIDGASARSRALLVAGLAAERRASTRASYVGGVALYQLGVDRLRAGTRRRARVRRPAADRTGGRRPSPTLQATLVYLAAPPSRCARASWASCRSASARDRSASCGWAGSRTGSGRPRRRPITGALGLAMLLCAAAAVANDLGANDHDMCFLFAAGTLAGPLV